MEQALLKITGRVQGVFFRSSAQEKAQALELSGYTKNLSDGSVEALVQGEKDQVEKFIKWCKEGPASAIVESVETVQQKPTQKLEGFEIH